jgi:hypothetical protein
MNDPSLDIRTFNTCGSQNGTLLAKEHGWLTSKPETYVTILLQMVKMGGWGWFTLFFIESTWVCPNIGYLQMQCVIIILFTKMVILYTHILFPH